MRPQAAPAATIATAAILTHLLGLDGALEWSRSALADGEGWRLLTGHLSHVHTAHLIGNVLALALLAALPLSGGGRFWWLVTAGCLLLTGAGLLLEPDPLATYRGLSGVSYGLWAAAACTRLRPALAVTCLAALAGIPLAQLTGWLDVRALGNAAAGQATAFVHPSAHLWGLAAGCAAVLGRLWLSSAHGRSRRSGPATATPCPHPQTAARR